MNPNLTPQRPTLRVASRLLRAMLPGMLRRRRTIGALPRVAAAGRTGGFVVTSITQNLDIYIDIRNCMYAL